MHTKLYMSIFCVCALAAIRAQLSRLHLDDLLSAVEAFFNSNAIPLTFLQFCALGFTIQAELEAVRRKLGSL